MGDVSFRFGGGQCWMKGYRMMEQCIFESFKARGSMAFGDGNGIGATIGEDSSNIN